MPLPHVTSLRSAWLCGVGRPWAPGRSRGTSCRMRAVRGCGGAGAGAVVVVEKSKCGQLNWTDIQIHSVLRWSNYPPDDSD